MENFKWNGEKTIEGIDSNIFLIGKKFHETSKLIDSYFLEPKVVNLAFSIELYLKSLNTKYSYSKKGNSVLPILNRNLIKIPRHNKHQLNKIFKQLNESDQINLIMLYSEKHNSDLIEDLSKLKNTFIDFRYSFEKESLIITESLLERIASFLKEYVENKMKSSG
ncbi:hypothetical protein RBH94_11265 [Aestuariibaculum sp. YM273]|uniref:hypothetical protein n=1 Tax=Aestuariibaculum sp. YM273 TaxID=3070659 RepID=UPI0027DE6CD7|nr:hypothetical protein [Aestuariibaculum sp. YM273]WMI64636.1 hypothetical protein RBH94_11265 [Aestuariibaculum sp. YM273]